jgi:hypothetical protein
MGPGREPNKRGGWEGKKLDLYLSCLDDFRVLTSTDTNRGQKFWGVPAGALKLDVQYNVRHRLFLARWVNQEEYEETG